MSAIVGPRATTIVLVRDGICIIAVDVIGNRLLVFHRVLPKIEAIFHRKASTAQLDLLDLKINLARASHGRRDDGLFVLNISSRQKEPSGFLSSISFFFGSKNNNDGKSNVEHLF